MAAAHWWSRWLVAQAGVDPVTGEAGTTLQSTGEPEVGGCSEGMGHLCKHEGQSRQTVCLGRAAGNTHLASRQQWPKGRIPESQGMRAGLCGSTPGGHRVSARAPRSLELIPLVKCATKARNKAETQLPAPGTQLPAPGREASYLLQSASSALY